MTRRVLFGWGRTAPSAATVLQIGTTTEAQTALRATTDRGLLARGLGRSYGDAAQNAGGTVLEMSSPSVEIDDSTGVVRSEAGVTFDDLIRALLSRGWFVPVTPGTRRITVGGAVASDVHGKNHHADGSWANHVLSLELLLPDGSLRTVSPTADPAIFWATLGGMGLTGVVLSCTFQAIAVETPVMTVDTWRTTDLEATMALMAERDDDYRYTVAWLDATARGAGMGRGVVTMADHTKRSELVADTAPFDDHPRIKIPGSVPSGLLNPLSIRAFNELWYRKSPKRRSGKLQRIGAFFHPLDLVGDWNRLYGRRGMLQYQFVVPMGEEATLRFAVERLADGGASSFLTVLKRFGAANNGHLSFPLPGWTLTLDVPASVGGLGPLLDDLDRVLVDAGGRVYLAKDSRLDRRHLARMYPRLDEWRAVCDEVDPGGIMQSDLSRRLGLRRSANKENR